MEFVGKLSNLSDMLAYIVATAKKVGFEEKEIGLIELSCEEAIVNVMHHGYKGENDKTICIELDEIPKGIKIHILDEGVAFDPTTVTSTVDIEQSADERKIGGLGIYLIKKLADQLEYKRENEKNRVTMTFLLNSKKRRD